MENQTPPRKLSQKKKQSIKNSLLVTKYTMSGNIKRLKNLLYVTIGLNIIFGLLFIANDFISRLTITTSGVQFALPRYSLPYSSSFDCFDTWESHFKVVLPSFWDFSVVLAHCANKQPQPSQGCFDRVSQQPQELH